MNQRAPAQIGDRIEDVDTPALLVDLNAFERNIEKLASAARDYGIRVRPHAKTHKCPDIAKRQMAAGAVGICCQKVSEAEAMIDGGIADVLITNEIVGELKIRRLMELTRRAKMAVCVDDISNVRALSAEASRQATNLTVLVEVNVGDDRCGVEPGDPVVGLAEEITRSASLTFGGLHAYHGRAQHVRAQTERVSEIGKAVAKVQQCIALLSDIGIACGRVTGAGSGTYRFESASGVYTELQAGSYIFMDADYGRNFGEDGEPWAEFENSLFVLSTVMSRPTPTRVIFDAGLKAMSVDSGQPVIFGIDDAEYLRANDEHGRAEVRGDTNRLPIGTKLRLIPGHCDPTVNLHDWYVAYRGDRVEELWPIAARGPGL